MGCGASKTPVVEEANKPTKAEPAADAGKASTSPAAPAAKAGTPAKSAASPAAKGGGATGSTPVVPLVPAAKGGAVIFCLGNEACGKEEICAKVAAEVGGSYLLATDLLRDAVESGSDEGNQLAEMIKQGKIVPASMTTALLTAAMADKPAPYLVDGFPKSLDNLGSFEEAVGACTLGLYFELPDDEARAAMLAQGKEAELIERKLRNFATQTVPITQALEGRALLRKIAAADRDAAMGDALAAVQALSGGAAAKPAKKAAAKPAATPKKAAAASSSAAAVEVPTGAAGVPIVFVLGGPGAGKTAICAKAVERFPSCSYFAAGDLIRDEVKKGTEQGRAIAEMIKEGKIVPTQARRAPAASPDCRGASQAPPESSRSELEPRGQQQIRLPHDLFSQPPRRRLCTMPTPTSVPCLCAYAERR